MNPSHIHISDFDYELPESHIPYFPPTNREDAKLLVYKSEKITSHSFKEISKQLPSNTLLVFNNTEVIKARLYFKSATGQTIEIFCLEPDDSYADVAIAMSSKGSVKWKCLVGNLKKWKQEFVILTHNSLIIEAKIIDKLNTHITIEFLWNNEKISFAEVLHEIGNIPIPPYFKREISEIDTVRYQTVYAKHKGSVAAPTAGLHFTETILQDLHSQQVKQLSVTLHVGAGTFMPVKSEQIGEHIMHAEWIDVDLNVIQNLLSNIDSNIIPVGTTSLRTIETLYWMGLKAHLNPNSSLQELEIKQWDPYILADKTITAMQSLEALIGWLTKNNQSKLICKTQILIAPPYQLKLAKGIITNFHQPKSTLLLLISAIVGDNWKSIYKYALANNFKFLSYGDSSLLLP